MPGDNGWDAISKFLMFDDRLEIGGVRLESLYVGRPTYIVVLDALRENIRRLKRVVGDVKIRYALKTLSRPRVLQIVKEEGLGVEAVSLYELEKTIRLGFEPDKILYNGLGKDRGVFKRLFRIGVEAVNIDSEYEFMEMVNVDGWERVRWGFRLILDVEKEVLDTASRTSKFGLEPDRVIELVERHGLRRFGLHVHIGSQVSSLDKWRITLDRLMNLVSRLEDMGVEIEYLDVGGGLPKDYLWTPIPLLKYEEVRESLYRPNYRLDEWADLLKRYLEGYIAYIEPGRYIVADAVIHLTRVVGMKKRLNDVVWLFLDSGFNYLASGLIYKWYYPLINVSRASDPHDKPFRVGGILCDSDDIFHDYEGEKKGSPKLPFYRHLPSETSIGDILAFLHVGAYNIEEFMNYNSHPNPVIKYI